MIEEQARVADVRGNRVYVETTRKSACASCSVSSGCGNALIDRFFPSRDQKIRVLSDLVVEKGDQVIIGLYEEALLRGSFLVYFLPLVTMIVFSLLTALVFPSANDAWVVLAGITGLVLGFAWIYLVSAKLVFDKRYHPFIVRKLHGSS